MHLATFAPAFSTPGPVATACLDVSRDSENGAVELELRWRALRGELAEQGAPDAALALVEERVMTEVGDSGGWGRAVAATAEDVLVDRLFPGRPRATGAWGPLPHLMPLLTAESAAVPYILVVADRVGADITVAAQGETSTESVEGEDFHIRKVKGGGWAQKRYFHGIENTWEANASDVAARIDRLVLESGAELVALAGDVRATQLVRDNVAERTRDLVHVLEGGGRADGAADDRLMDELTALRERRAFERVQGVVDVFVEQRERRGRAARGLAATVEALRRAQVDTLLVPPDWDDHEAAWFGPDPALLGLKMDDLTALGVENPQQGPVVDVIIRAAAGTDAQLVVVPDHLLPLDGEPAALLRFADESTAHTDKEAQA